MCARMNLHVRMRVRACVRACVCLCLCVRARARLRACVRACVRACAVALSLLWIVVCCVVRGEKRVVCGSWCLYAYTCARAWGGGGGPVRLDGNVPDYYNNLATVVGATGAKDEVLAPMGPRA